MNSAILSYQLPTFTGMTRHDWPKSTAFLRDTDDNKRRATMRLDVDAQVRSGDYFVTLATTLDQLGKNIADYDVRASLEDHISDLIYLQDNYTIIKDEE